MMGHVKPSSGYSTRVGVNKLSPVFLSRIPRALGFIAIVVVAALATSCQSAPTALPSVRIALEKMDSDKPPLGANLVVSGTEFTPGGRATVTITNTNPDGVRQTQNIPVDSVGHFSTAFPFLCISYSKRYADHEMSVKVRDNTTGRSAEASIRAGGFWVCQS